MAGSRPTSTTTTDPSTTAVDVQPGPRTGGTDQQKIPGAPLRVSFAKIREPLEVPDLLALQTASFDWLVGAPEWKATLAPEDQANAVGGLAEILEEISPIEDFSGSMSLSFSNPRFEDVKASLEECKDKDMTYAAPLFVTAEFMNNTTGEIKSQTVFMGDFPIMTNKGTFVINGTERVVVSQLVRSPGVYFDKSLDKTSDKDVFSAKVIPSRGAWLEFDVDKRDTVGVRIDRKRRQPVTVLLKALGWTTEQIRQEFGQYESMMLTLEKDSVRYDVVFEDLKKKSRTEEGPTAEMGRRGDPARAARHLPQAAPGRAADGRGRADAAQQLLLKPQALRPGQGRPLQDQQEARSGHRLPAGHPHRRGHRRHDRLPRPPARG